MAKGVCVFLLVIMGKKNFKKKGGKTLREYSLMKMKMPFHSDGGFILTEATKS